MVDRRPLTAVQTLVLDAGREADLDRWLADLDRALCDRPDRDGGVVRLDQAGGIVHLLYRFAGRGEYDAWRASESHHALAAAVERFAISRWQVDDAGRPHFGLPSEASAPKWKRSLVSWATVFPLLLATSYANQALVPDWPRPVTLALSSLLITLALNLAIFPLLNRRLDPWLLKDDDGGVRTPDDQNAAQ